MPSPRTFSKPLLPFSCRGAVLATLALVSGAFMVQEAAATSARVKIACASDYFAYCRAHAPNSPGVRHCMRAAGPKLSKRCINALILAGEVSEAEVSRRAAELRD
ncbi:MAG TPA: hypothetical protein PKD49_04835 [Hyphomicrobium sp.]|nr:hypothetical protein [Hyphomicrobium sp.]